MHSVVRCLHSELRKRSLVASFCLQQQKPAEQQRKQRLYGSFTLMLINNFVSLGTPSWSVVWVRWIEQELSMCMQVPWQTPEETRASGLTGMLLRYTHLLLALC